MVPSTKSFLRTAIVLAALALSACGGGGDDGPPLDTGTGDPSGSNDPAPVILTADATASPNTTYSVGASGVTLTLPPSTGLQAGDRVSVSGASGATQWNVRPNTGQRLSTAGLAATVAPTWTASGMPARRWHWVASNATGEVLAAAEIPGTVHVSTDGGANWTPGGGLPADRNWISVDMTTSGDRMVAVAYLGGMYRSTDRGATWTRIDEAFNPLGSLEYESVTVSGDGERIAAGVLNGPIHVSDDGGDTFTAATAQGGAALVGGWRALDSSADGMVVVAADQEGALQLSTDGGGSFTPVAVRVDGTLVEDGWYRLALSRDGGTIAVAGNPDFAGDSSGLYVSRDQGTTWTRASTVSGPYTGIAMSADGATMVATISSPGQVLLSTDGGASFAPLATPDTDSNWRTVAMTADGLRYALAAGRFELETGQLYTSAGVLSAGPGGSLELEYAGDGLFVVRSSGGELTIR